MSPPRLLAVAAALALAGPAAAHDLRATVAVGPDHVRVEAFYVALGEELPAGGVPVTLLDAAGAVVRAGRADDRGVWACPRPAPGAYTVVAEEAGHRAAVPITVDATARTFAPSRLDPRVGAAVGLAVIAVGTVVLARLRRARGR